MYVYKITNLINGKKYIGITNNYKKRWGNHKCNNDPSMAIAKAIKKYGSENFEFKVLYENLSIEQASEKEQELIISENSLVPNGYNVAKGGMYSIENRTHMGHENGKALLSYDEALYIKSHRNIPLYVLYDEFSEKISYEAFKKIYQDKTYKEIIPTVPEYPYNTEFSNQFTSNNKLTYDEVVELRIKYSKGIYWKDVYEQEYKDIFENEWTFWNIYNGVSYKLVMPEVFTEENKKLHSKIARSGEKNGRAKLTKEQVLDIRKKAKEGIPNIEIYKLYPQVTPTSIRDIINRKTWKNI